ncbi:carbohydrate ABC transporter permease [Marinimicrococcus flavescens]|uniref:Maltose/maltodextrin transport system permease protein MalG n=1 Tax=Marinimicrococcus flavescens TaxID=3031815 RepID=A0AAP3V2Q3_9PROT|nr:carbohydrate ABC transporter permease [Marinimicrococcus flavescens]
MSPRARRSLLYWLLLSPLVAVILFPYAVMLSTALKPAEEIFVFPPTWLPSRAAFGNFLTMWEAAAFGPALRNSLLVSLGSTLVCLAIAVPAAYATARMRFAGKGVFRQLLLVTQMLSPIVLVIGIFRLMASLGLVDQLWSLILTYAAFNLAFAIWMLQSYFASIPKELEEAAWIDGASRRQSIVRVFLPLAMPAFAVTSIFTFVNCWNEFVLALTLLRSAESYTLTLKIFSMVGGAYRIDWHHVMAATLLATVPVAVVFAWLQRGLVRGLALGAVK